MSSTSILNYLNYNALPTSAASGDYAQTLESYATSGNIYPVGVYQYNGSIWQYTNNNQTISQLNNGGTIQNGDTVVIVRSGVNYKATYQGSSFTLPSYATYADLPVSAPNGTYAVVQTTTTVNNVVNSAGLYQGNSTNWILLANNPDNTTIVINNGKLSIAPNGVSLSNIQLINSNTVVANLTNALAAPSAVTLSALKTAMNITKFDVGLGNVQNVDQTNATNITSGTLNVARLPLNIPATNIADGSVSNIAFQYLSGASANIQQQLIDLAIVKANLNSPAFTGIPTAPTAPLTIVNTQIATTAYVQNAVAAYVMPLTNSNIFIGNSSNQAAAVLPTGDWSMTNTGVSTINVNVVSNSKLAQAPALTVKCNPLNVTGNEQDINIATSFKPLLQLTKNDVGLNNVPNIDATNLANDTIQGTFTPSIVSITSGDSGLVIAQKTQGQLNNKQNLIVAPTAADFVYTDGTGQSYDSGISLSTDNTFSTPSNLQVPTTAAVKVYVQNSLEGRNQKINSACATTTNITLSGLQVIDGYTTQNGDRVVVKNQTNNATINTPSTTNSPDNGIYIASSTLWVRSSDANTWAELVGAQTFVEQGTINGSTGWICNIASGGTLGVTPMPWAQNYGVGTYTAGTGLQLNPGNQFAISNTGITPGVIGGSLRTLSLIHNAQGQLTGSVEYLLPVQTIINGAATAAINNSGVWNINVNYDNSTIQLDGSNQLTVIGSNLTGVLKTANNLSDVVNQQLALNNITNATAATGNMVLTKNASNGNAVFENLNVVLSEIGQNQFNISVNGQNGSPYPLNFINNVLIQINNNQLSYSINGISGQYANVIQNNSLTNNGINTLTSVINTVSSAASIINNVTLTSSANLMTSTVNTISNTASAPIINSNTVTNPTTNTIGSVINGVNSTSNATIISTFTGGTSGKELTFTINGFAVATTIPATVLTYTLPNVIYVSANGNSSNDGLSLYTPKNIAALNTLGNGGTLALVLPSTNNTNINISALNVTVAALNYEVGALANFTGTITVSNASSSVRFIGITANNWVITASGNVQMYNCTSNVSFAKSGSGYLLQSACDTQGGSLTGTVSITGGSSVFTNGCTVGTLTVNNSTATLSVLNGISSGPVTLTAGTLQLANTNVYAVSNTANAITATGGTLFVNTCGMIIPSVFVTTTPFARVNISNSCSYYFNNVNYDNANSTLGTTILGATNYTSYSHYVRAINVTATTFTGNLAASNITGIISSANLPANTTYLGNTVNSGNGLLQLSGGIAPTANLPANITYQGNTFNTANGLVQIDANGKLPTLDGSNLTNINLSNAGTLPVGSLPFYGQLQPCVAVSTSNITTISGPLVIDNIAPSNGQRVLIAGQTIASQNGIYIANFSGVWPRSNDMPNTGSVSTLVVGGITIPILSGDIYGGSIFQLNTTGSITIGTTALNFACVSLQSINAVSTTPGASIFTKIASSNPLAFNTNIPVPTRIITGTASTYTATYADSVIISNCSTSLALTLPAVSAGYSSVSFTVITKTGITTVTVAGGGTINGVTTMQITVPNQSYVFTMIGGEYFISSSNAYQPINAAGLALTGSLAIGSAAFTPVARVHIKNSRSVSATQDARYFNLATLANFNTVNPGASSWNAGLAVEGSIVCDLSIGSVGNITGSDIRIKNVLEKTNLNECVDIIKKLEVTKYEYIDKKQIDFAKIQNKFIAQQVQQFYPEAVHTKTNVIPDILKFTNIIAIDNQNLTLTFKNNNFKINPDNQIKIVIENKVKNDEIDVLVKIVDLNDNIITVQLPAIYEGVDETCGVFVYGQEVNDFLYIDYDAIFSLNVAATQYLLNKVEQLEQQLAKNNGR